MQSKNYINILVGYLVLFSYIPLWAQEYTVQIQAFGIEEGLLHREVSTVFEDNSGFIWIGSEKGVQRFDGYEFKSWTEKSKTQKIFSITAINQDQDGWLWLWNNDTWEFVFLDPVSEEILTEEERFGKNFPIKRYRDNKGWHSPRSQLPTDSKGRFYFTSSQPNQLIVFDTQTGFESIPLPEIKADFLEIYFMDSQDNLWLSERKTGSTLHKLDLRGNILASYDYKDSYDISSFREQNHEIYYQVVRGEREGYYKIDKTGNVQRLTDCVMERRHCKTNGSLIWRNTETAWEVYMEDSKSPLLELKYKEYPKVLTNLRSSIYEDSRGRVWFPSTWGLGLAIIKPNLFQQYFSFDGKETQPINNSARGILVKRDTIYANFEFGGLVGIPKAQPEEWFVLDKEPLGELYYGRPIARSKDGGLYTGHKGHDIRHVMPGERKPGSINFQEDPAFMLHTVWSFYQDKKERLWIGMGGGLAYKEADENFLRYVNSKNEIATRENTIFHISEASGGNLWLCGSKYVLLFDPETKSFLAQYGKEESQEFNLPARTFYYMHTDAEGIHWLGTNEGLLRWDRVKNEKKLLTGIDGLSNDVIYAVFEDEYQHLWLSSDYGIMRFNKETFHVNSYLEKDGISHQEFNRISAFQEKNGTIYFGGLDGITAFHPSDFYDKEEEVSCQMLITDFEIFDGAASKILNKTGELRASNEITFHPEDRFFRLKFALPLMDHMSRVTYAWKVEGVDEEWNYQKENTLQIGKLPYGDHLLRVKGQGGDGRWAEDELAIKVVVIKPVYLQTWFILLALCLLLTGIFLFYRIRTRRFKATQQLLETEIEKATTQINDDKRVIEEQANELRQLDKMKSRFFANVSHELRTPLTLVMSPISSVLKKGKLEPSDKTLLKKAQQNSKALLKLIGSILDLSKMESGKMELNEQAELFYPFIRRIISTFESHAQRSGIQLSFVYKAEKNLQIEIDKDKVEVIFNNLISNAIKFTPKEGKILITVEDIARGLKITVEDNGRGIHPYDQAHVFDRFYQSRKGQVITEGGTGIGLALTQEFVKMMGGTIWVESEYGKGSSFFVEIPKKEVFGNLVDWQEEVENGQHESTEGLKVEKIISEAPISEQTSTILIVEDNYSLRDYLQKILSPFYSTLTVANGAEALQAIEKADAGPQLILSDIMMPVMDGYQLLERIKGEDRFCHLPVIILTARADIRDKLKALRIGVDDYLVKPFEEEELLARIKNLLNNYENRSRPAIENSAINSEEVSPLQTISTEDQLWLEACEKLLKEQLGNTNYSISNMAADLSTSESTLARQLKRLTGLSPFRYLQEIRLNEAQQLLRGHRFNTIAQVAYQVGFSDANAFSRAFKKRFGLSPSSFIKV